MTLNDALELYKKDLEKILSREEKKLQKANEKAAEKIKNIIEEYSTENDVMEAYGCGMITEHKKDKILEMLAIKNHDGLITNRYIKLLKKDINNIDLELKYPTDKEPIEKVSIDPRIKELEKENEKLRSEIKKAKKHNARGAGRKASFTDQEKEMIKMYRIQRKTIAELAEMFKCSTGLIHKIINE